MSLGQLSNNNPNVGVRRSTNFQSLDRSVVSAASFLAAIATILCASPPFATASNSVHSAMSSHRRRNFSAPDLGANEQDRIGSSSCQRPNNGRDFTRGRHAGSKRSGGLVDDAAVADMPKACPSLPPTAAAGKVDAPLSAVPPAPPLVVSRKDLAPKLSAAKQDPLGATMAKSRQDPSGATAAKSCTQCSNRSSIDPPVTVLVNLNARTFMSSRRDCFHPMTQCRSLHPDLSGPTSLPGLSRLSLLVAGPTAKSGAHHCSMLLPWRPTC
jgi:hypothetical protein